MAEDVAMFRFENNASENAQQIAAALHQTVSAIHEAARAAGGTSVSLGFGSEIVREAERAARDASAAMAKMLDPANLTGKMSVKGVNDVLTQSAGGAFQQAQREIDKILAQLGPDARARVAGTGELDRALDSIAKAIIAETRGAYEKFRREVEGGIANLPAPSRLGTRLQTHMAGQTRALDLAAESRTAKVFGEEGEVNGEAYLAAEVQAEAARVKIAAARSKEELAQARRELGEALASMIGAPGEHENRYAKALGYTLHPETGKPVRAVAGGYEEIVDPVKIERATQAIQHLREEVENTKRLLGEDGSGGVGRRIGKSQFFVDETRGAPQFYENAQKGGVQYLRLLNDTETRLKSLTSATEAYKKEQASPGDKAKVDAERARADAERQAQRQQSVEEAKRVADAKRVRGFVPGVIQGAFGSGFNGTGALDAGAITGNLGRTVGSAARYSLAYGGFYQFMQATKDALAIFVDFQDSFTDYQVALGSADSATQSTTNGMMELSRVVGENVGAAYDSAARGVRAFASDASEADKRIAGFATASAAQKVSVIANKGLGDATGDVIAVGSAYGLSASQAELQIPDALSNAKRNLGGDPNQISQGLANFAVSAKLAGYSIQEAANIVSLVQSKTDESGQAVATRLTRVIQILGGTTGKTLAGDVNRAFGYEMVNTKANPKTQLTQFGRAYAKAGDQGLTDLQSQITSQLGGTANLKEILPLLEASGQKRLADALAKSKAGAGMDEYDRKVNNLIGTLNKLKASVQNLVVLAANADLFAPFAGAVKVLEPTMHMLERVLQVYEKLEGLAGKAITLPTMPFGEVMPKQIQHLVGPVGTSLAEVTAGVYAFQKIRQSTFARDIATNNPGLVGSAARGAGVKVEGVAEAHAALAAEKLAAAEEATAATLAAQEAAQMELDAAILHESVARERLTQAELESAATVEATTAEWAIAVDAVTAAEAALADAVTANAAAQTEQAAVAETAAAETALLAGETATLGTAVAAVGGAMKKILPLAIILATALAASDIYGKSQESHDNDVTQRDLLRSQGATVEGLSTTRNSLRSLGKTEDAHGGLFNYYNAAMKWQTGQTSGDVARDKAGQIDGILKRVRKESDALGLSAEANSTFGAAATRTVDSLSAAFKLLSEQGESAHQILDDYYKALMTKPQDTLGTYETPETSAAKFTQQLNNSITDAAPKGFSAWSDTLQSRMNKPGGLFRGLGDNDELANQLSQYFNQGAADKAFAAGIKKAGKNLNKRTLAGIANQAFDAGFNPDDLSDKALKNSPLRRGRLLGEGKGEDDFRKKVINDYFLPRARIIAHQVHNLQPLTPAELTELMAQQDAATAEIDPSDPTAAAKQARENYLRLILRRNAAGTPSQQVAHARRLINNKVADKPTRGLDALLGGALTNITGAALTAEGELELKQIGQMHVDVVKRRHEMRVTGVAEAEDLRKAAESRVKKGDTDGLQQVRINMAKISFRKAGADVQQLEGLFESLDRTTIKALLDYQDDAVHKARLAYEHQKKLDEAFGTIFPETVVGVPGAPKQTGESDETARLHRRYVAEQRRRKKAGEAYDRSAITSETADDSALTKGQREALLAQAKEDPNNSLEVAKHNVDVAKANLKAIGKKYKHSSNEYINALQQVNQAQNAVTQNIQSNAEAQFGLIAAQHGGGAMATAVAAMQTAQAQVARTAEGTPEHTQALTAEASAGWQKRQANAQRISAIASAGAARSGGAIASARAAIKGARAMMGATERNTGEWFEQLGSLYQGQQSLRDAILQYKNNLDLLHGDSTNPVEQARDAMRAAARQFRNSRNKEDRAAARVAEKDARNQYQDSKFQQRFSDMQTSEDLGRISFAKYMQYLDHEHDRLSKIHHRTRQQQDQLDTVDKAIKDSLSSMDSQFNLGDINTNGLVYQVRRFKAELNDGASNQRMAAAGATNQSVTISINGADTAMVKRTIDGYLRIGGGQRQTLTRRKV